MVSILFKLLLLHENPYQGGRCLLPSALEIIRWQKKCHHHHSSPNSTKHGQSSTSFVRERESLFSFFIIRMAATELRVKTERFKREDCNRTKHDSDFSKWKLLVGPSDWEDHCNGKEGATRYRIHNLPSSSGPGIYELGIAWSPDSGLGRNVSKLDSSSVLVVYLGQAGNVRKRLQGYGRSGNHLGKMYASAYTNSNDDVSLQKGPSFFEEISSLGYSIVYRSAAVKDKSTAEKTEARLLETFDYAWNKGQNGASRPNDVRQKLKKLSSSSLLSSNLVGQIKNFGQKPVGIKIKALKPLLPKNESHSHYEENKKLLPQVFKFMKSQPRPVSIQPSPFYDIKKVENLLNLCGVILGNGSSCIRLPVPGRVRCEEHKGLRINSLVLKVNSYVPRYEKHVDDVVSKTCGATTREGNACTRRPGNGSHRCWRHEEQHDEKYVPQYEKHDDDVVSKTCGATTLKGYACTRQPGNGSHRCWQHEEKHVDEKYVPRYEKHVDDVVSKTCGATTLKGYACTRRPGNGSHRCWQHE